MIELAFDGKFSEARDLLRQLIYFQGYQGQDIVLAISREIPNLFVSDEVKVRLVEALGETDYRIAEGGTPEVQLLSFLAKLALVKRVGG
jgi:replication factor C small subunit